MSSLKKIICTISFLLISFCFGCGTATNNDQGTVFTALGFFSDTSGSQGTAGVVTPLFTDSSFFFGTSPGGASVSAFDGLSISTTIGVRNNLGTQFIRLERIDCSYDVQGSSLVIPDDSFAFTAQVEPISTTFQSFQIVSPDIFAYLNNNLSSLPALPFRMNVTCSVVGVSRAGDVYVTNDARFLVQFADGSECCTGGGFFSEGGDFQVDGGAAATTATTTEGTTEAAGPV